MTTRREFIKAGIAALGLSFFGLDCIFAEEEKDCERDYRLIKPREKKEMQTNFPIVKDGIWTYAERHTLDSLRFSKVKPVSELQQTQYNDLIYELSKLDSGEDKILRAYKLVPHDYEATSLRFSRRRHNTERPENTIFYYQRHPYITIFDESRPGVCEDKAYSLAKLLQDAGLETFVMTGKQLHPRNEASIQEILEMRKDKNPVFIPEHSWTRIKYADRLGESKEIDVDRTWYKDFCAVNRSFMISQYIAPIVWPNSEDYQPYGYRIFDKKTI